jgi:hypothetical protein
MFRFPLLKKGEKPCPNFFIEFLAKTRSQKKPPYRAAFHSFYFKKTLGFNQILNVNKTHNFALRNHD